MFLTIVREIRDFFLNTRHDGGGQGLGEGQGQGHVPSVGFSVEQFVSGDFCGQGKRCEGVHDEIDPQHVHSL